MRRTVSSTRRPLAACVALAAGLTLGLAAATAQQASIGPRGATAFVGAHLIPIAGPEIDDGVLVVEEGRILAVGARDDVVIPDGAARLDASGRTIMPGLICTHSHIGGGRGGDGSGPIQPEARILDSINVRSSGFRRALAGGLTTLNIRPVSGHLASGQTVYVKLRRDPGSIAEMAIRTEDGSIAGGLKMANGTNSMRKAPFPGTGAKSAALVRATFIAAQEYRDRMAAADPESMPERDLAMECLVEVRRPAHPYLDAPGGERPRRRQRLAVVPVRQQNA